MTLRDKVLISSNKLSLCSRLPNSYINFDKFWQLAKQVTEFMAWKQVSCPFEKDATVIKYLHEASVLSEKGKVPAFHWNILEITNAFIVFKRSWHKWHKRKVDLDPQPNPVALPPSSSPHSLPDLILNILPSPFPPQDWLWLRSSVKVLMAPMKRRDIRVSSECFMTLLPKQLCFTFYLF